MERRVLRPQKPCPKLDKYYGLPDEAIKTLQALEIKYNSLIRSEQELREETSRSRSISISRYRSRLAPAPSQYYRSMYNRTFKTEVRTPNESQSSWTHNKSSQPRYRQDCNTRRQLISLSNAVNQNQEHEKNLKRNYVTSRYQQFFDTGETPQVLFSPPSQVLNKKQRGTWSHQKTQGNELQTSGEIDDMSHWRFPAATGWKPSEKSSDGDNNCERGKRDSLSTVSSRINIKQHYGQSQTDTVCLHRPSDEEIMRDAQLLQQKSDTFDSPPMDLDREVDFFTQPQPASSSPEARFSLESRFLKDTDCEELLADCYSFGERQQFPKSKSKVSNKNIEQNLNRPSDCSQEDNQKEQTWNAFEAKFDGESFSREQRSIRSPALFSSCPNTGSVAEANSDTWISIDKSQKPNITHDSGPRGEANSKGLNSGIQEENSKDIADEVDFDLNFFAQDEMECPLGSEVSYNSTSNDNDKTPEHNLLQNQSFICAHQGTKHVSDDHQTLDNDGASLSKEHDAIESAEDVLPISVETDCNKEMISISNRNLPERILSESPVVSQSHAVRLAPVFLSRSRRDKDKKSRENTVDKKASLKNTIINAKSKRLKSSFKPPSSMPDQSQDNIFQQHSEVGEENTGKNAAPKVDEFVNLLNLEKTTQRDVLRQIQIASTLSLSLLFLNGQALVNTFSTNHDKTKGLLIHSEDLSYKTLYLPFESNGTDLIRQTMLKSLSNENCMKTIVNSKDFLIVLHRHIGVENDHCIRCEKLDDPVIASWLLLPENPPSTFTDMASLVAFSGTEDINDTNWHSCLKHVARLSAVLKEELFRRQLLTLYSRVEMKLVPLLACMETRSVKMDTKLLVRFSDLLKTKLEKLEQQVYKEIGHTFSLTSHPQLRQVLYEELKLDQKLTGKVKIGKTSVCQEKSTGESTLRLLAEVHPLPSLVLEYRQLQKLKSTYVDGMKACVRDGSLSTHWDQTAAATGRLTSCQPNVQAVPKVPVVVTDYKNSYVLGDDETCSTEIYAREPFVAAQGNVFLSADFQQIELRILAHLSGDSALLSMFWRPQAGDIFTSLYSQWHNKPIESVTSDDREQTKRVVYSVMYGVGKEKLADYLKVKADIAKEIMNSFLRKFPAIESFSKKCCEYAEEFGYTETLCGRRRYFTHISHRAPGPRAYAQRQAVNFCVQGSAADICKLAMLAVEEKLRENSHLRARLLLQIHDELLWELPEDQIEETKGLIQRVMEDPRAVCGDLCSLQVPLPVSLSVGKSWAHLTPVQSHPPPAPL